ncbi:hypothetical protein Bcav_2619 [Beutenbergia cavernae DSM 12333]|uniref:Peptidase inhibitor family I36 n=1 Tax=Beutenbergia cavernae (strain ATCC BAA-8 / DSM 12333 / CCUG 43141 / JCM 11478 / NBRC 16432 / NCIMB 13614 / HKI 0122) TaxID=471853 RepID=C5BXI1_BEUC1|nr:peptidase inhibitor family I36 protein [Beutenbergia cavernae]ACQ80864.1 hypothetical protein Bcav_2619 [Beutenbergia cavernae DSM 12333]
MSVRSALPASPRSAGRSRLRRAAAVVGAALALTVAPLTATAQSSAAPADVASPMSLNQCASGRMCVWSGGSYTGSFWGTASGGTIPSYVSVVGSYWNNSSTSAFLYSGRLGMCVSPGERVSTVSGWPRQADRITVSSSRPC